MGNLGCQLDRIWNQLKGQLLGTPVSSLDYVKQEDPP